MKIKRISDIAVAFDVEEAQVDEAVRCLHCESMTDSEICKAVNKNQRGLGFVPKKAFVTTMLSICRRYLRKQPRMNNPYRESGHPVRDRLLEVGKYNPNSMNYVGDVIKPPSSYVKGAYIRRWCDI